MASNDESSSGNSEISCKEYIRDAISRLQTLFGLFSDLPTLAPPLLHVEGFGDINTPITTEQALDLASVTKSLILENYENAGGMLDIEDEPTPHPSGSLDAGEFILRNPDWPAHIDELCTHISQELNITTNIQAELRSLIIVQPGQRFVSPHRITTPDSNVIGFLEINLPSYGRGGNVILQKEAEKKIFRPPRDKPSFIFRFSDVSQETDPVFSGCGAVLVYHLVDPTDPTNLTSYKQLLNTRRLDAVEYLRWALLRWAQYRNSDSREHKFFYCVLEEGQTGSGDTFENLTHESQEKVLLLRELALEIPFKVFFVTLNKEETTFAVDEQDRFLRFYEERNKAEAETPHLGGTSKIEYSAKNVEDMNGRVLEVCTSLDEENILQLNCFNDVDGSGKPLGNLPEEPKDKIYNCNMKAVVIIPRDYLGDFFQTDEGHNRISPRSDDIDEICLGVQRISPRSDDIDETCLGVQRISPRSDDIDETCLGVQRISPRSDDIDETCLGVQRISPFAYGSEIALGEACSERQGSSPMTYHSEIVPEEACHDTATPNSQFSEPMYEVEPTLPSFQYLIENERYQSFNEASAYHGGSLPTTFFSWLRQWLLNNTEDTQQRFLEISPGLSSASRAYNSFHNHLKAVTSFAPFENDTASHDHLLGSMVSWARKEHASLLKRYVDWGVQDSSAIIEMALYSECPTSFLSEIVLPAILNRGDAPALLVRVMVAISKNEKIINQDCYGLDLKITEMFTDSMDFSNLHTNLLRLEPHSSPGHGHFSETPDGTPQTSIDINELVGFFEVVLDIASTYLKEDLVESVVNKLISHISRIPKPELDSFWIPFLQLLRSALGKRWTQLNTSYLQKLYTGFWRCYVEYLCSPQCFNPNFERLGVGCDCSDCCSLNSFLTSSGRTSVFLWDLKRCYHLIQQIMLAGTDVSYQFKIDELTGLLGLFVTKSLIIDEDGWDECLKRASMNMDSLFSSDMEMLIGRKNCQNFAEVIEHILSVDWAALRALDTDSNTIEYRFY